MYVPSTTAPSITFIPLSPVPMPMPNVCPGCGHCNVCGRPNAQPIQVQSSWGYPPIVYMSGASG